MSDQSGEYKSLLKKLKSKGGMKQVSCEFCLREITLVNYLKCAICPNFFMCIACYSAGKEKAEHQRAHPYQVIDPLRFPLFEPQWTTKEEILLLEGLQKFGYGNWSSISEWMSSSKSMAELEQHYHRVYLHSKDTPRPDTSVLISERDQNGCIAVYLDRYQEPMQEDEPETQVQVCIEGERHPLSDFPGFMPKRRDFEVEFENDAEMYLADLDFYEDDSTEDRALKFRQLDVYNKILEERETRKAFLMDHWPKEVETMKQLRGPVERPIFAAMKPFARFLPPEKHSSLCQGLAQEYLLRLKLEELKHAKAAGVKTEAELMQFLVQKKALLNPLRQREYESLLRECFPAAAAPEEGVRLLAEERSFVEANEISVSDYHTARTLVAELRRKEGDSAIRSSQSDTTLVDFLLSLNKPADS